MLKVKPTKDFCDTLNGMQEKQFKQIWSCLLNLLVNPRPHDSKKIGEYKERPIYRVDSGEYRLVYQYDEVLLYPLILGKRNDDQVYKEMKRKL